MSRKTRLLIQVSEMAFSHSTNPAANLEDFCFLSVDCPRFQTPTLADARFTEVPMPVLG